MTGSKVNYEARSAVVPTAESVALGVRPEYARNGPRVVSASDALQAGRPAMFNSRPVLAGALLIASRAVRSRLVWAASVVTSPVATAFRLAAITPSRTCGASAACAISGHLPQWGGRAQYLPADQRQPRGHLIGAGSGRAQMFLAGGVSGLLVQGNAPASTAWAGTTPSRALTRRTRVSAAPPSRAAPAACSAAVLFPGAGAECGHRRGDLRHRCRRVLLALRLRAHLGRLARVSQSKPRTRHGILGGG